LRGADSARDAARRSSSATYIATPESEFRLAASTILNWRRPRFTGVESIVPWLKIADRLPRKHTMEDPSVADAWTLAKKRTRVRNRAAI
jgi:hypothetical protein